MISDEDVKKLIKEIEDRIKDLDAKQDAWIKKGEMATAYRYDGRIMGLEECLIKIQKYDKKSLKGFSTAVYGKKVSKEIKKNPRKSGKKMAKAYRDMF